MEAVLHWVGMMCKYTGTLAVLNKETLKLGRDNEKKYGRPYPKPYPQHSPYAPTPFISMH